MLRSKYFNKITLWIKLQSSHLIFALFFFTVLKICCNKKENYYYKLWVAIYTDSALKYWSFFIFHVIMKTESHSGRIFKLRKSG